MFLDNPWPPNAVLIEYVADMHQMDLSTFSKSRLASLRAILGEIHDAKVYHGDADPRNMMVVSGKPDSKTLTPGQQNWMEGEIQRMDYFVNGLACSRWILTNTVLTVHPRPKTMQKENRIGCGITITIV
jgi:hypothetical protein